MDHIYIKYLIISQLSLKLITVVTCMFSDSVMTTVSEVGVRGWGCSECRGLERFFLGGREGRRGLQFKRLLCWEPAGMKGVGGQRHLF